jgi:hypothetical protein
MNQEWETVGSYHARKYRSGTSFLTIEELYDYWMEHELSFYDGIIMMSEFYRIKAENAEYIWYVLQRSRGTPTHIQRLVKADKVPSFDWLSVMRGDENKELERCNL